MDEAVIRRILDAYGVSYAHVQLPQKGYRNSSYPIELTNGELINLILYKNEPHILQRIKRAHRVANDLARSGLPVRRTIDPRIIALQSGPLIRYAALYNYLPGETIPWEAYTRDHIKLVGMAMSAMHVHLRESAVENTVSNEYRTINRQMRDYFARSGVMSAMQRKLGLSLNEQVLDRCERVLGLGARLPDQQVLHMDFVRGNLLFSRSGASDRLVIGNTSLSGIIDFEKVAYGHPVFDIARTLAFLLVDCKYKSADKVRKYFLHAGYNKRGQARYATTPASRKLLGELTTLFLIHDFYKFLCHNPYEYLEQNEHFVRTRDILIERKVLESG